LRSTEMGEGSKLSIGRGDRNRNLPIGGLAYGIPWNDSTPFSRTPDRPPIEASAIMNSALGHTLDPLLDGKFQICSHPSNCGQLSRQRYSEVQLRISSNTQPCCPLDRFIGIEFVCFPLCFPKPDPVKDSFRTQSSKNSCRHLKIAGDGVAPIFPDGSSQLCRARSFRRYLATTAKMPGESRPEFGRSL